MYFWVFYGEDEETRRFEDITHRHAKWLGMNSHMETYSIKRSRKVLVCGFISSSNNRPVPITRNGENLYVFSNGLIHRAQKPEIRIQAAQGGLNEHYQDENRIKISLISGDFTLFTHPTSPDQVYYSLGDKGFVLGNDARLLMRWTGAGLDERAVYALLEYRAIPAPLTITKNVHRIPGGHAFQFHPDSNSTTIKPYYLPGKNSLKQKISAGPEGKIQTTLDRYLEKLPESSCLFFSGGVDSGLFAARFAAIGRHDIQLINFAFSPNDPEAQLAQRMAAHLGMKYERVTFDPKMIPDVLERIGKDYTYPFGDLSLTATNMLVHASLPSLKTSGTVVDGTGGDGAFGMAGVSERWHKIYSIPHPIRQIGAETYKALRLWQRSDAMESRVRKIRRSVQMPMQQAAIVGNTSLNGVAYVVPTNIHQELSDTIRIRVQVLGEGLDLDHQMSLLDLTHVCAGRFAAKVYSPLANAGARVVFPFLEPGMVSLSCTIPGEQKNAGGETKALLKKMLVKSVPREMIYRPKSAFRPPVKDMFSDPAIQAYLADVVLAKDQPLRDYFQPRVVEDMVERTQNGQSLGNAAYNFLWVLLFTAAWINQQDSL